MSPTIEHSNPAGMDKTRLDALQHQAFDYFRDQTNPANGLVADRTETDSPASIAAVGFALAVYPVGVSHGWMMRDEAAKLTLATLRFFWSSEQGTGTQASGYKGFYYHFLDMRTGKRAGTCELSTVDTGLLLAGMLVAEMFFDQDSQDEREIRRLAENIYRRVDWVWACNGRATITHGWKPESGFLPYRWEGYDEALLLYLLALGSPTRPLPPESYQAWCSTYEWKKIYDQELIYGGPLFTHQYSHIWVDFRGIHDGYTRERGVDYFENSQRAVRVQQEYAIRNPLQFAGYQKNFWALTASDGPGWHTREVDGIERSFFGYVARGAPFGPDDGTVAPWAVLASLPFEPAIVLPTVWHFQDVYPQVTGRYCFRCSFNLTYLAETDVGGEGWTSSHHFGINLGPVVLMIENYRSEFTWLLMRACPHITTGLRRARFSGNHL